jgi:tRNA uridine 5-carbamoylmethylation protein Kti12
MNYIKGFRYELHCISKASGQRHGVLWVLNSVQVANAWNEQRKSKEDDHTSSSLSYLSPNLMDELRQRYEPPDARNRWDHPLYTIDMSNYLPTQITQEQQQYQERKEEQQGGDNTCPEPNSTSSDFAAPSNANTNHDLAQDALQRSVYNMHALRDTFTNIDVVETANPVSTSTPSAAEQVKKSTFKRAGFRRPPSVSSSSSPAQATTIPNQTTFTAMTLTSNTSVITPLTLAALQTSHDQESNSPRSSTIPNNVAAPTTQPRGSPAPHTSEAIDAKTESSAKTLEERVDEILESFLYSVQPLKEGASTRVHVHAHSNVLHTIDTVTQQVIQAIVTSAASSSSLSQPEQQQSSSDGRLVLARFNLTLSKRLSPDVTELQRLRQQYLRWVATYPPTDTSEQGIAASFVSYIEAAQP